MPLYDAGTSSAPSRTRGRRPPGEVVLLSPACTTFDQYGDFEARGAHFRGALVGAPA